MLESSLSDFAFIKETLDKEGDHNFFGRNFSFFSTEPILFYNSAKDVIVYMNSHFADEFSYTVEDLSEWKYSIYPLLSSEDQAAFSEAIKKVHESDGDATLDATYKLLAKNKKYSYYRVKVRKLHKSYYFIQLENSVKTAMPVLKNRTADELMNDAEAILKFGFWMLDKVNDKLFWTKGMFHLLEYDDTEDVTPSISFLHDHIIKDDSFHAFEKKLAAGEINDSYRIKYRLRTNHNNVKTVTEHGRVTRDENGVITSITGLIRDITMQEESMRSLADYKTMMQENESFLKYGTWESNPDGSEILWTKGMYEIFGYGDTNALSSPVNVDLYDKHITESKTIGQEHHLLSFLEGKNFYHREFEIKDAQGFVKILSTYAKIIRDNNQVIQKIVGTTRDVTQLKEYEKTLENKIEALNRSNSELEEFAYVASHDMQEPLRKITTFGQRLKNQIGDDLTGDSALYLSRMLNAAENMRNLIDNLLEYSRITRSHQSYQKMDFTSIVNESVKDLDILIAEADAAISAEPMPEIECIPSQMQQLFTNLLQNAIKFRKKEVPLVVKIRHKKMDAAEKKSYQLAATKEYHLFTVTDNGIGLEQKYAEKIFQLFQRLEGKSEYPGTGIGLSICRKIVTNHKGLIFAAGVPGEGTVLSVILPKHQ